MATALHVFRVVTNAVIGTFLILMMCAVAAPPEVFQQQKVVEFNTVAPQTAPPVSTAQKHADSQGLTDCRAPASAELDDVFLASPVDSPDTIVEVDLDTALDSAGKRHVLLACDA